MPTGAFKVTDIPEGKVDEVMAIYALDGPTSVVKNQQPNGLWTVTATFPGPGESTESYSDT